MIQNYCFGKMTIEDIEYKKDLILFPDRILNNWRRKEGHRLYVEDIQALWEYECQTLVVGTGYFGFLKITEGVIEKLASLNIDCIRQRTGKAWKTYNGFTDKSKVIAAFHLTC